MIDKKYDKYIQDYIENCNRVQKATQLKLEESPSAKAKRIKKLESKYSDWFEYYFPQYASAKCAWYHNLFMKIMLLFPICFVLYKVFRSGAKSVHACMGAPMYLMVKKQLEFMLLVGLTEPKAKQLLSDIQANLEFNQRFINDYGKKLKKGSWSDGDFTTIDGVKFVALGFGQSPRGIREQYKRPDYIVISDIDTKERCNNDKRSRQACEWVWEDLKGCFDEGAKYQRMVVENNDFHPNTVIHLLSKEFQNLINLYKQRGEKPRHHIIEVPAVKDLVSFEPNWPEKTTAEYWKRKFEETPYRSFMREYMHVHIQDGTIFKHENIHYKKREQLRKYDALILYGDLSYKDQGDYKALVLLGKTGREYHILKVYCRKSSRAAAAKWLYDLYEDWDLKKYNIRYYVEGLFAQDEFVNDFDLEGQSRGYYIPVVADKKAKANKEDRIESMSGYYERNEIYYADYLENDPDCKTAIDQILAFEKGSKAHDDYPDAQQSAMSKANEHAFVEKFETRTTSRKEMLKRKKNRY